MSKKKTEFTFTVNGGAERKVKVASTTYVEAVAAIPAIFGISEYPLTIKIWVPILLPDYGPYNYYIDAPGGRVGAIHKRWDDQEVVCYSTA